MNLNFIDLIFNGQDLRLPSSAIRRVPVVASGVVVPAGMSSTRPRSGGQYAEGPTWTRRVVAGAHVRRHQVRGPGGIGRSHDVRIDHHAARVASVGWACT
jgi:hypothetical protein